MSRPTAGLLDVLSSIGRAIDNGLAARTHERAEAVAKLALTSKLKDLGMSVEFN